MGRQARQLSSSGFYHVVFRGINHQHIFENESDYTYFLKDSQYLKGGLSFEVHAYCLMSNHVHLLLREKCLGDISLIMKRLLLGMRSNSLRGNKVFRNKFNSDSGSNLTTIPAET